MAIVAVDNKSLFKKLVPFKLLGLFNNVIPSNLSDINNRLDHCAFKFQCAFNLTFIPTPNGIVGV